MATPILKAEKREGTGKGAARKMREAGRVPAVLYGRELDTLHISVNAHDTEHLFQSISVDNTIVGLQVEGESEPYQTLVREIQSHPWKATLIHIDFLRIQAGVAVDVDIPIHLIGIPSGVKNDGGVLEQIIHDLPIKCIPSKIPESIEVDVTALEINDVIHVYDIDFDEGIEVLVAPERTICSVAAPRLEEEEAAEDEEALLAAEAEGEEGEEPGEESESAESPSEDDER